MADVNETESQETESSTVEETQEQEVSAEEQVEETVEGQEQEEEVVEETRQLSDSVPYNRFKEVNEGSKAKDSEIAKLQTQLEAFRTPTKADEPAQLSPEEIKAKYGKDPYGYVKAVFENEAHARNQEIKTLKEEQARLQWTQEVQHVKSNNSDFDKHAAELKKLINNPNVPINWDAPGALELGLLMVKGQSDGKKGLGVKRKAGKPAHVESAKTSSRVTKDTKEMSLAELRASIGVHGEER